MLSERIKIASVIRPATIPSIFISIPSKEKYADPHILADCEPTPTAPSVCAMVLSVRMAERGWSIFCLYLCSFFPIQEFSLDLISTKEGEMLKKVASHKLQRKDTTMETVKYKISNAIDWKCFDWLVLLHYAFQFLCLKSDQNDDVIS